MALYYARPHKCYIVKKGPDGDYVDLIQRGEKRQRIFVREVPDLNRELYQIIVEKSSEKDIGRFQAVNKMFKNIVHTIRPNLSHKYAPLSLASIVMKLVERDVAASEWGDFYTPLQEYRFRIDATIQGKNCSLDIHNVRSYLMDSMPQRKWYAGGRAYTAHQNPRDKQIFTLPNLKKLWFTNEEKNDPWKMRIIINFPTSAFAEIVKIAKSFNKLDNVTLYTQQLSGNIEEDISMSKKLHARGIQFV
jgi:hypothetical protein